jgi:hypothetical protein
MTRPNTAEIDPARTARLGDGWRAAVCVDERGEETMWVVAPDLSATAGCACRACAPHEQIDPKHHITAKEATT